MPRIRQSPFIVLRFIHRGQAEPEVEAYYCLFSFVILYWKLWCEAVVPMLPDLLIRIQPLAVPFSVRSHSFVPSRNDV